jgi:putative NADPH-quinone reductase
MRVLVLYAHPLDDSYAAALHETVVGALRACGHEVDDCDLYAEGFDPVLSGAERRLYHSVPENRAPVDAHVARFEATEGLVVVSPIWNLGYPAILKGYLDRVFLPGVTFTLSAGKLERRRWLKRVVSVHTFGAKRWQALLIGDPPRLMANRLPGGMVAPGGEYRFLGLYDMNNATPQRLDRFRERVAREMRGFA